MHILLCIVTTAINRTLCFGIMVINIKNLPSFARGEEPVFKNHAIPKFSGSSRVLINCLIKKT